MHLWLNQPCIILRQCNSSRFFSRSTPSECTACSAAQTFQLYNKIQDYFISFNIIISFIYPIYNSPFTVCNLIDFLLLCNHYFLFLPRKLLSIHTLVGLLVFSFENKWMHKRIGSDYFKQFCTQVISLLSLLTKTCPKPILIFLGLIQAFLTKPTGVQKSKICIILSYQQYYLEKKQAKKGILRQTNRNK